MKQSRYPRVGEIVRSRRGRCRLCNQPKSDTAIVVQVNWLRGDDEVFAVHAACIEGKKSHELLQILIERGLL